MSVINRNITRTVKNSTETTYYTSSPAADTVAFNLTTSDAFYIGFKEKFTTRYFHFGTLNATGITVTVTYWDGSAWSAVKDLIDQTAGFTKSGFVSWTNQTDWTLKALSPITDVELYWVKVTVSATMDSGTTLQSVLNLFCDSDYLRVRYPELVYDSRYLPPGRTDFVEQLIAGKDEVVLRLKKDGIIEDESEVIDINEVANAAAHATAWVIFHPLGLNDEELASRAAMAEDAMNKALNRVPLDLDVDNSGTIDLVEEDRGSVFYARG